MLQSAPRVLQPPPRRLFHPAGGRCRALAHQLRQAGQRLLQAHRHEIHLLLAARHGLQRVAQAGRPRRPVQAVAKRQRRGARAQGQA
ncbi:MAG TPA: hypothetical protein PL011_02745, partial [Kiritimatiellia bacterium]|nr:hypothetical protein [Kiritimatiellia bacterium]